MPGRRFVEMSGNLISCVIFVHIFKVFKKQANQYGQKYAEIIFEKCS
jgi:hypothetical protein